MTRVFALALLLALTLMGCHKKFDTPTTDTRFFGNWAKTDSLNHDIPFFNLRSDGSFSETSPDQINLNNVQQAESWAVYNSQLHLTYIIHHKVLYFINRPKWDYVNYTIKLITDSTLTLTDAVSGGPQTTFILKKVKGKRKI